MTQYLKQGNTFKAVNEEMLNLHGKLPVGCYTIKLDPFENFYFEQVDSFTISNKIYGNTINQANKMLATFNDRPNSTGVLLTGEKGSGKTLLAKMLSVKAAEQDMPTIIINTAWHGDKFNTLIQSIEQPCVILFDEFEKVYDQHKQEAILTLLDGVFPSKKMFVLTCNDSWRIDKHMTNRPGRIYYMLTFRGLDIDFITSYCEDNLNDKTQIENVRQVSTLFSEFNFDLLKALCEEMNRYNETAQDAIKMLNAKPQSDDGGTYKVTLKIGNKVIPANQTSPAEFQYNPLSVDKFSIAQVAEYDAEDEDTDDYSIPAVVGTDAESKTSAAKQHFSYQHLKKVDPLSGSLTYINDSGATVTFTKIKKQVHVYAF